MPVGYVRLHGRNYEHWFTSNEQPAERYNYLYSIDELKPWAERVSNIARTAEVVFVVANNHFQGKAIANALELISLLRRAPVPMPENLLEQYPKLAKIALPQTLRIEPKQSDLAFDTTPAEQ
jgi:uncharacterized protein YecE (DUF72 family)